MPLEPQVGFGQAQNFWLSSRTRARALWACYEYTCSIVLWIELTNERWCDPSRGWQAQVWTSLMKVLIDLPVSSCQGAWWVKNPPCTLSFEVQDVWVCLVVPFNRLFFVAIPSDFCPASLSLPVVDAQCTSSTPFSARRIGWYLIVCSCVFHIQATSMLCAPPSLKICLIFVLEPLRFATCLADPLD